MAGMMYYGEVPIRFEKEVIDKKLYMVVDVNDFKKMVELDYKDLWDELMDDEKDVEMLDRRYSAEVFEKIFEELIEEYKVDGIALKSGRRIIRKILDPTDYQLTAFDYFNPRPIWYEYKKKLR
jgi:hypothetical protein